MSFRTRLRIFPATDRRWEPWCPYGACVLDCDPLAGLRASFQDLPDPRMANKCQFELLDIISITILAVLCGADG